MFTVKFLESAQVMTRAAFSHRYQQPSLFFCIRLPDVYGPGNGSVFSVSATNAVLVVVRVLVGRPIRFFSKY